MRIPGVTRVKLLRVMTLLPGMTRVPMTTLLPVITSLTVMMGRTNSLLVMLLQDIRQIHLEDSLIIVLCPL